MSIVIGPRRLSVATLLLTCYVVAAPVFAVPGDPLTLAEAQRLAIAQSEKLQASDFTRSAAAEIKGVANALPDPVLRFGVDNVPVSGADKFTLGQDFMTMTRVGVMQEFTRGNKRTLRNDRAKLDVAMAQAESDMTRAQVQREVTLAWFNAFYAQRQYEIVVEQAAATQAIVIAVQAAYAQGRGSSADVLAARGMAVQMQDGLAQAAQAQRAAHIQLARWIGDAAQRSLAARPAIDALPLHAHQDLALLEAQLRDHPDIVLLDKQLEAARTDAQLARAEQQSDWSVELSYGKRGAAYDDMISLGVSIPLQLNRGNRQNRELAARLSLASAAKAQRDDLYREHVAEVRSMLDEWQTAHERHAAFERELLPLAQDRIAAADAAYRGGKLDLEQVIAARRNLLEASLQTLKLESEIAMLWAKLSYMSATNSGGVIQ